MINHAQISNVLIPNNMQIENINAIGKPFFLTFLMQNRNKSKQSLFTFGQPTKSHPTPFLTSISRPTVRLLTLVLMLKVPPKEQTVANEV